MLMADTMAIFFVVLGLLLAFPGLWLLCRGLWPRAVTEAAAICGKGLIKPFVAGLPVTVAMIFGVAVLSNFGSAGKIAAVAGVCLYILIARCGLIRVVAGVGPKPGGPVQSHQPESTALRGAASRAHGVLV